MIDFRLKKKSWGMIRRCWLLKEWLKCMTIKLKTSIQGHHHSSWVHKQRTEIRNKKYFNRNLFNHQAQLMWESESEFKFPNDHFQDTVTILKMLVIFKILVKMIQFLEQLTLRIVLVFVMISLLTQHHNLKWKVLLILKKRI